MKRMYSGAVLAALTAGALGAQTTVCFPSDHDLGGGAHLEGSSSQYSFPFSAGVARQMMLYETFDLKIPDGSQITELGFPRDGAVTSTGTDIILEIYMGKTTKTAADAVSTFDDNYDVFGSPKTLVYSRKTFSLPDLGIPVPPPQYDEVWVPLDGAGYTFDASHNLLVEYVVHYNALGGQPFNYYLDGATFLSPVTSHGAGCPISGGAVPRLQSSATAIGYAWATNLWNAPAGQPVALIIGIGLAPVPVPLPSLSTGCDLLVDLTLPNAAIAGAASGTGYAHWSIPVPNRLGLYQASLYLQMVAIDPFLFFVTSNAEQTQFGMNPRMTLITAPGATAVTGGVYRNWGALSLFKFN